MHIVVDEDIPFAADAFAPFGEVRALKARDLTRTALRDADALVVRSVTRVGAELLEGAGVRFVGTATSGTDHVDLPYLRERGIAFANAVGANANAVAEYVVAALLELRGRDGFNLAGASLGIVGFGHVGRRVARYAAALGMRIVVNDPPLARATCEPLFRPIEEVLACDVVTVHVPLEHNGTDPTHHLINDTFLNAMKSGAALINTARGAVADTTALKSALAAGRLRALILDVWENEPSIDVDLAQTCRLATAHIAGHTLDAKIAAVQTIVDAFTHAVGAPPHVRPAPGDNRKNMQGAPPSGPVAPCRSLAEAVRAAFDIAAADRRLRDTLALPAAERAAAFDALRAGWPSRREFHARFVAFEGGSEQDMAVLRTLGFRSAAMAGGPAR